MAVSVDEHLREASELLDRLERERNRLGMELLISSSDTRDAYQALTEQIDRFVGDVFVRLERKARETNDAALASRLVTATRNILALVTDTLPMADEWENRAQFVRDVAKSAADMTDAAANELKDARTEIAIVVGIVLALVIVVYVVRR